MKDGFVGPHVKVQTGIEGLDEMLAGGLLPGRPYLVVGPPGSGKTTLALQFLLRGVRLGENVLYVTIEEPPNEIKQNFRRLPRDLDKVWIFDAIPDVMRYEKAPFKDISAVREARRLGDISTEIRKTDEFRSVEIAFSALMQTLKMETVKRFYSRIVIDSLTALEYFCMKGFDDVQGAQVFLRFLSELKITTLLTVESPAKDLTLPERMLARGEVHMFAWEADKRIIRAIGIEKFRGSPHDQHLHPYRIASHGIAIDTSVSISKETREIHPTPPTQDAFITKPTESELALEAEWALLTLLDDVKELLERGVDPGVVRELVQKAHSSLSSMHIEETFQYLLEARELVNHLILVHQVSAEMPDKGVNLPGLMHAMSEGEELPAAESLKPKTGGEAGAYMQPLLSRLAAMLESSGGKRIAQNLPAALINRAMASTESVSAEPAQKVELKKEVSAPAVIPPAAPVPREPIATRVPGPQVTPSPAQAVRPAGPQPQAIPVPTAKPVGLPAQPVPAPIGKPTGPQSQPPSAPVTRVPGPQMPPSIPQAAKPATPQAPTSPPHVIRMPVPPPSGHAMPVAPKDAPVAKPPAPQASQPSAPSAPREQPPVVKAPTPQPPPIQREREGEVPPVMGAPPPAPPVVPRQAERVATTALPLAGPLKMTTQERIPPSTTTPPREPVRVETQRIPVTPPPTARAAPVGVPPLKVVERPPQPPPSPPPEALPHREEVSVKPEQTLPAPPPREPIERIAPGPGPVAPPVKLVESTPSPQPPAPAPPPSPTEAAAKEAPPSPQPAQPAPVVEAAPPVQPPVPAPTAEEPTLAPSAPEEAAPPKKAKRAPKKAAGAPAARKPRKTTAKPKKTLEEAVAGEVPATGARPEEPKPKPKRAPARRKTAAHESKEGGAEVAPEKKPEAGGDPPASS